jgi:hypothetical protein
MPTKNRKNGRKHGAPAPAYRTAGRHARSAGGQPGNKNAEKHGFYSRRFSTDESKRLEGQDRFTIESELDLIRVCMDRLAEQLSFETVDITIQGNTTRDNHYLQQLNTLSLMTQSISTMIRTHYLTRGKGGTLEQGIMEALEELRLELGL